MSKCFENHLIDNTTKLVSKLYPSTFALQIKIFMFIKNIIVALLVLPIHSISFSQNTYHKGYYITNTSDTIQGYIGVKELTRNPSQFKFKKQDQNDSQTLGLHEVAGFSIENYVIYKRFFVSLTMNDVRLGNESVLRKLPRNDTVFLKLLSKGKFLSLYSFIDELKARYYVMPVDDHVPEEMIYEIEKNPKGGTRIRETYKQQLYTLAAKTGRLSKDLEWKLKNASYTTRSLTNVVNFINGSTDSNAVVGKIPKAHTAFYGGAGLAMTDLTYQYAAEWSKTSSPSPSFNPYFLIGFKFWPKAYLGRYSLRAEVSVSSSSFKTVATKLMSSVPLEITNTFNQLSTGITFILDYKILTFKKTKVFLGAGFRMTLPSYSNNMATLTTTYPTYTNTLTTPDLFILANKYYSFSIRTSFQFSKRMECLIEFNPNSSPLNTNNQLWDMTIMGGRIGLNYFINPK